MRLGPARSSADSTVSTFGSPALVVVLVLLLGFTIYLWRQRYLRRTTAYVAMAVLLIAILVTGFMIYQSPG